jgi:trehalose/maltose hydrolase-like predicted phosphorylase
MAKYGAEIMLDGAKYWASRLVVEPDGAHIRDVMGPNEYHAHVDDSFFTNAMAAWQLRKAREGASLLGEIGPSRLRSVLDSLQVTMDDLARYANLADQVVLGRRLGDVIEERLGFFELEPIDLGAFLPSRVSLHGLLGDKRSQEVQLVKQADVLMALVLLEEHRVPGALEASFDFYAPITDHGSSLSLAMHSVAASMIGRPEIAYDYFRRALAIDHDDAMARGGNGIHAAAQGGILQAALFGFGGLTLADDQPQTTARLPESWDSLGFSFMHHGVRHERLVTKGKSG